MRPKARTGYIPEKLVYICRPESEHITKWDESDEVITKQTIRHAFVTDPSNKKTVETGKSWATGYDSKCIEPELFEFNNGPIDDVAIVGYSHRSEGGGAYQAIIKDKFLVDFRDDVMLDTIRNSVITNGKIQDVFIWARVGSEMKLVRVGSWLHKEMLNSTAMDNAKPIDCLELGGVYQNKKGDKYIYLGIFPEITVFEDADGNNRRYYTPNTFRKVIKKNHLVFQEIYNFYNYEEKNESPFDGSSQFPVLYVVKSHSFKTKVGHFTVPADWIQKGAAMAHHSMKDRRHGGAVTPDAGTIAYYAPILSLAKDPILDLVKPLVS